MHSERDRGQAVVLLLACVALISVVTVAMGRFGARLVERQQAEAAADAAALAGSTGGQRAASVLAAANGGVLEGFAVIGLDVLVVVRVGDSTASARATRAP